uniref:PPM-type phosphatase domain-containing protein n=1 Tax=Ditylenchus dipsaci TaxID=166011 RepID=A0A915CRT8_9BILA
MEDRHIILPTLAVLNEEVDSNDSLFAVFDGHHGPECASYASAHFHTCLLEQLKTSSTDNKQEVMKKTFDFLDKRLTLRCEKESIKSGTTASCVYISDGIAYTGWCGDSSIGILRRDKIITISKRHSPSDPLEQKRIEEAGAWWLVFKANRELTGLGVECIKVVRRYSSKTHASDGVWDMVSECEIYNTTTKFFETHDIRDYEKIADVIAQKAKENGSSDNLTLIAVFLQPVDTVWKAFGGKVATE